MSSEVWHLSGHIFDAKGEKVASWYSDPEGEHLTVRELFARMREQGQALIKTQLAEGVDVSECNMEAAAKKESVGKRSLRLLPNKLDGEERVRALGMMVVKWADMHHKKITEVLGDTASQDLWSIGASILNACDEMKGSN